MVLKDQATIKRYLHHLGPNLIAKIKKGESFADIGCAKGQLLKLLQTEFHKPKEGLYGFDISQSSIAAAKKTLPHIYYCDFGRDDPPKHKFDVVFALDILEHIENPSKFLENITSLMKNDSLLVLSTPNINSFSRFVQGPKWYGFKDKTHQIIYCSASLSYLLEQHRLRVCKFKTISATGFPLYDGMISTLGLGGQLLLTAKKK